MLDSARMRSCATGGQLKEDFQGLIGRGTRPLIIDGKGPVARMSLAA